MTHRPGLLDDPRVVDEVAAAARLAMESERLQAELCAQLEHLRASRQRIVAAADVARRRLERYLHDGAQQQLVGLLLRLRRHRAGWPTGVDSVVAADDLRELAHGPYPSVLAEEGLAPAVEHFAEAADVPVTLLALPEQRLAAAVESAGYVVVAEAIRRSGACAASARLQTEAGQLVVDLILSAAVADGGWVTVLEDWVGALEGTLTVRRDDVGDLAVRVVIRCAS